MKTLLRLAAMAALSGALVLGGTTASTGATGDAVTSVRLKPTTTTDASTFVRGTITTSAGISVQDLTATVTVDGHPVATGVDVYADGYFHQRAWGAGIVSLTDFKRGSQTIQAPSNKVRVRYAVDLRSTIKIKRSGSRLTFRLKARYIDKTGGAVGLRAVTVQVKKNGRWQTLKRVSLNRRGLATFTRSDSTKRSYRMTSPTTRLVQGSKTPGTTKV